jgi:hypothetical protein
MIAKKTVVRKKRVSAVKADPAASKVVASSSKTETPGKNYVGIDFPQEGEILTSGQYTLRISTSATEGVEVSIDGKGWEPCRECVGFWWYDWSGFGAGAHTVVAKISVGKRSMKSKARSLTAII